MFVAEVRFASQNFELDEVHLGARNPDRDFYIGEPRDLIDYFLSALRGNGQVLGREFPIAETDEYESAYVMLPAADALDGSHHSIYVRKAVDEMVQLGMGEPEVIVLGEDAGSLEVCSCSAPTSYVLYTDYVSLESPVRCGDEFLPVPLYRIPPISDEEQHRVIFWASEYESCDRLWMNSEVLERAAYRQLHDRNSPLTRLGLEVRDRIASVTQRPVYYYLLGLREGSRSAKEASLCPQCGGEWLLERPWHELFDYRCDRCHLLSSLPGGVL